MMMPERDSLSRLQFAWSLTEGLEARPGIYVDFRIGSPPMKSRRLPDDITIAAAAVAIGLLPLPYEYYMLLRLFLCGVSVFYLSSLPGVRDGEKWVLTGLAILHNPVFPIELGSKLLWGIINVATVVCLWILRQRARSPRSGR